MPGTMRLPMLLYDPNIWSRTAVKFMPRGSSSRHIVCDAVVVAEALASVREAHGWPLSLVAFRFERDAPGSRKGRVVVETHPINDLPGRVAAGNDYFYFVRDESRHPDLSAMDDLEAQAWFIINGLPLIMFNTRDSDGGPGPATHFSIAGAIAHKSTWEIVRHEAEVEMYKALVARVRKLVRGKGQTRAHTPAPPATERTPMPEKDRSSEARRTPAKRSTPRSPNSPPREGDVYAIQLDQGGFAYAHVLKIDRDPPRHGPFIRVFQTVTPDLAWDDTIARSGERFRTFFPVSYAQRAKRATRVASIEVPTVDQSWPVFKSYLDKPNSNERIWFRDDWANRPAPTDKPRDMDAILADVKESKLGDTLPRDLLDAPFAQVVNLTALCRMVATNWTHRTEVRERDLRK